MATSHHPFHPSSVRLRAGAVLLALTAGLALAGSPALAAPVDDAAAEVARLEGVVAAAETVAERVQMEGAGSLPRCDLSAGSGTVTGGPAQGSSEQTRSGRTPPNRGPTVPQG